MSILTDPRQTLAREVLRDLRNAIKRICGDWQTEPDAKRYVVGR